MFELTAHVKSISRGDGRSATAAAAYRACCEIVCEREGRTHDYSRKGGLEAAEIVLPKGAPAWAMDRASLWNAAELRERNKDRRAKNRDKANARPARELLFTFPVELSAAGRLAVARTIAGHLADAHAVAADFALHQPGQQGDERNFHCHLMWTARRLGEKGFGEKTREWDDFKTGAGLTRQLRAIVADALNHQLAAERKAAEVHVEHRSFADRGEPLKPTRHQGPTTTHIFRQQQTHDRSAWQRQARASHSRRQTDERASLKGRQAFALRAKTDALDTAQARGIDAIRARLRQAQAADPLPSGLSRTFQVLTGQAGRAAFDRAQRSAARDMAADREIADLKRTMQADRSAYVKDQQAEAKRLDEKHRRETDQLKEAVAARHRLDLSTEAATRRDRSRGRGLDRDHERDGPGRSPGMP